MYTINRLSLLIKKTQNFPPCCRHRHVSINIKWKGLYTKKSITLKINS